MDDARSLFHDVADLAPAERNKYFDQRSVPSDLRAEVESLLKFDALTGQMRRGLVETVVQQESGIPAHHTIQAMEEETAQIGSGRELADVLDITLPTRERSSSQRAMWGAMIDAFDPDPEAIV